MIFRTSDHGTVGYAPSNGHARVQSGNCDARSTVPLDPRAEDPYLSEPERYGKVTRNFSSRTDETWKPFSISSCCSVFLRHNIKMNYDTGICTLEFKPDQSDLGRWVCKFTDSNGNSNDELGSASLVLLNNLGGAYFYTSPINTVEKLVFAFAFLCLLRCYR